MHVYLRVILEIMEVFSQDGSCIGIFSNNVIFFIIVLKIYIEALKNILLSCINYQIVYLQNIQLKFRNAIIFRNKLYLKYAKLSKNPDIPENAY